MPSNKSNFLWGVFTAINGWITFADTKAMGILAAEGVIAGVVLSNLDCIILQASSNEFGYAFMLISMAALVISIFFAIECVIPYLYLKDKKTLNNKQSDSLSPLYFEHIADMELQEYQAKTKSMLASEKKVIEEVSKQIWVNSKIASKKHNSIVASCRFFIISICFAIFSILTIY